MEQFPPVEVNSLDHGLKTGNIITGRAQKKSEKIFLALEDAYPLDKSPLLSYAHGMTEAFERAINHLDIPGFRPAAY
jgi:hypothetical protein